MLAGTLSRRTLGTDVLRDIAAGLAQAAAGDQYQWTQGANRRYTCLLDTPLYDAWLIEWSSSASLDLHDHGGSQGAVVVCAGTLVETYSDLVLRHPIRDRIVRTGESFTVPTTRVHEVSNRGIETARSVHVYSPPLRTMTFYDHSPANFLAPVHTGDGNLAVLEETTTP